MTKTAKTVGVSNWVLYTVGLFFLTAIIYLLTSYLYQNKVLVEKKQLNRANCLTDDCLAIQDLNFSAGVLPKEVKSALDEAINDEYKALTTYQAVIAKFGLVRPFSMIQGAEEQHISALKTIYQKYGLQIPANGWVDKVSVPATLKEACQIGVDAEIANASLYENKLLPTVKDFEDITLVFNNLMNASQQRHLLAFERCN